MARTVSLATLRGQALVRADMINSTFRTTAEVNQLVNQYCHELHELLCSTDPSYGLKSATFSTVVDQASYSLTTVATDFYKLRGLEVQIQSGTRPIYEDLCRIEFGDRNRYGTGLDEEPDRLRLWPKQRFAYYLLDDSIVIVDAPTAVESMRLWYVPLFSDFVNDGDLRTFHAGYEQYPIVCVAIALLEQKQRNPGALLSERAAMQARIKAHAAQRDRAEPPRIRDVREW